MARHRFNPWIVLDSLAPIVIAALLVFAWLWIVSCCGGCAGGNQRIAMPPATQPADISVTTAAAQALVAPVTAEVRSRIDAALTGVQYSTNFGFAGIAIAALLSLFCWLKHRAMAALVASAIGAMTHMFELDNEDDAERKP